METSRNQTSPATETLPLLRRFLEQSGLSETEALRLMQEAVDRRAQVMNRARQVVAAIDAIGLFESGLDQLCGVTVGILAPKADRLRRIMARDGISESYAQMRLDAQPEDSYFREKCGFILENTGTEADFRRKSIDFFQKFL